MSSMTFEKVKERIDWVTDTCLEPEWFVNEASLSVLERYCVGIDKLVEYQMEEYSYADVRVMMIDDQKICIIVESKHFTIDDSNDVIKHREVYEAMENALSFGIRYLTDSTVAYEFVYPSVWDMR